MPLDTPTTDSAHVQGYIEDAARWLWRSMEARSSMVRIHCCRQAALGLFSATALSDGRQRCVLAAHFRQADALSGQFYGDGIGVHRLFDELQTLTEAKTNEC